MVFPFSDAQKFRSNIRETDDDLSIPRRISKQAFRPVSLLLLQCFCRDAKYKGLSFEPNDLLHVAVRLSTPQVLLLEARQIMPATKANSYGYGYNYLSSSRPYNGTVSSTL